MPMLALVEVEQVCGGVKVVEWRKWWFFWYSVFLLDGGIRGKIDAEISRGSPKC